MSSRLARHLRIAAEPLERRYLGLHSFDMTVKQRHYSPSMRAALAGRDDVEVVFHSFELDPSSPRVATQTVAEHLGQKTQEPEAVAPPVQQVCAGNFGNSDIFGGTYPDPTP